ncbi:MAG: methyltransferase domain-containing protein [Roseiarcus sp.]
MNANDASPTVGPSAYAVWRASALGAVTETLELRTILDLTGELNGACMLDVGCGDGALACAAAKRGADVVGVDPEPAMLEAARSRARSDGVAATFLEGRAERLPFPDGAFDVVAAVTVLCFIPDAVRALREMARVLRPGGRLVTGELGRWSTWAAARRLRSWFGSAIWRAARFRDAGELRRLAVKAELSVEAIRGVAFYPPVGLLARVMAPIDPWLGRRITLGAAFIALRAVALGAVATTIGENGANIDNLVFNPSGSDFHELRFDLQVLDIQHLNSIIAQLRDKPVIAKIERLSG